MTTLRWLMLAATLTGCAAAKPVARTANDIARDLCELFFTEKQGTSVQTARELCALREVLDPFIREVLSAQQRAGADALPVAQKQER